VFRIVVLVFVVLLVLGVVSISVLAQYTSWKVPAAQFLATALLGGAAIYHVRVRFGPGVVTRLVLGEFPGEVLVDVGLIVLGAILLIMPGIVSDLAGLCLLIPPVRWTIVAFLRRRELARFKAQASPSIASQNRRTTANDSHADHSHSQLGV
jgi:UPF0716 protein FxsA